ncbi:MAG: response regulator [Lachnospira sp.]|nr:response regulator [Lachnospira sp.]
MNKKILLIADDDEMSRKVIQKNFSDTFDVIESRDGKETLEIIHNRPVDIVILDIVMPQYNGFEVLKIVKCDEKYSDIRILVATSLYEKTEKTALELGADDIVFKPYDPVVIKKRINNLLTMQEQKRELENALLDAENANKAKTNFLSRISHDMRTPLNGILGITTLLKDTFQ